MSQLHHPNVLMLIGACVERDNLMIVTEMMTGNVYERLHSSASEPPSLFRRLKWAEDTCLGMTWLHRPGRTYLHMDLKTQNLLIDEKGAVKVADFGLSQFFHTADTRVSGSRILQPQSQRERTTDMGGTAIYRAPELLHNEEYNQKCDVYSFGIVLWELYSCKVPFQGWQLAKVIYQVSSEGARPPIDEHCPESLRRLIEDCWQHDPEKRPHFSAVLPRLQAVILELAIQSLTARAFWQQRFGTQERVSWRQFYAAFADSFAVQRSRRSRHQPVIESCFREMVCDRARKGRYVTMRSFSDCVAYFGPLHDDQGAHFMKVIFCMLKLVYFHGDLSKEEAERRLAPFKRGTFLVRFSTKSGQWTASVRMGGRNQIGHIRLGCGGRVCENFPTFLRRQGKQYRLRHVCPCDRYQHIFFQATPDGDNDAPVDQTNYSYMMIDEVPGFAIASLTDTTL
jgi:Protein tyrosine and serine/threonine kinase/SH2 domain